MKPIKAPLRATAQGPQVADLQDALLQCLERGALLANDPNRRQELGAALQRERPRQTYADATAKLVGAFQEERRLRASGEVDDPTAAALNALLKAWGLLEEPPTPVARVVTGAVRREDGVAPNGLRIRAVHHSNTGHIRLGDDTTDRQGRYTIRYDALPDVQAIALGVMAIADDGTLLAASEPIRDAKPLETIDLTVVLGAAAPQPRIEGTILMEHGLPAEQMTLRLYRRDFGGKAVLIDETTTVTGGRYAFTKAPATVASLEVRAVVGANEEPLSKPLNDLREGDRRHLNLVAPGKLRPLTAEFGRLAADLTPLVDGRLSNLSAAKENAVQQDLTTLNRATGWDARVIALAAMAERLALDAEVGLPSNGLYALLRVGLPSDKRLLAQVDPEVITLAMTKSRKAGIVDLTDQDVAAFQRSFKTFADRTRLGMPVPGSRSTYRDLLKTSGLPDDAQDKFAPVYLNHRSSGAQLWVEAQKAGLDSVQIRTLQLQGKLAFLGSNAQAMTARLMTTVSKDPVELVDKDFHTAARWEREVLETAGIPQNRWNNLTDADRAALDQLIPPAFEGEKVERRLAAYADEMARKVRVSYPTHVLARLLETDANYRLPAAHDATVKLLKEAASGGFRLGQMPVSTFLKNDVTPQIALSAAELTEAGAQLKGLQRLYQITPGNEAIPVMMKLGITSSFDVNAYQEDEFADLFNAKYVEIHQKVAPSGLPQLVSRKAQQVSSITYNLFAIAKKLESEPVVAGISAPIEAREAVKNELIKQFPTLESLFGSMDYCECDHCRSVLSPAAYFVDLLQFVDTEPGLWANFLARWKTTHDNQDYPHKAADGDALKPYDVLIERRPDLPHIALTCENSHTALPYIDIVNEILEYFVANGRLDGAAVHDTTNATTAELLAEPQYVIREAYDVLRGGRYPLRLPFDLWIETVRQFCDYCETPLHRVLETFRATNDLFAPAEPFDRADMLMESLRLSPADVAIFTDANPLANDAWHGLYGLPSARPTLQDPTNTGNATVSIANADAAFVKAGLAYTYFDTSANNLSTETKIVTSVGAANSAGAGRGRITFDGTWTTAPAAGDLLVCAATDMLKSAKTLARRLGVTFKEIAEIVRAGFVNPELSKLSILYKLGVSIADARFYVANKPLLGQDPSGLSAEDKKRRLEVVAFADALRALATSLGVPEAQLDAAIVAIPFNRVLVLADPDAGCNFDLTTLRYSDGGKADPIVFLRINLFVRLWRALGWTIEETDAGLQALIPKNAPYEVAQLAKKPLETALIYLAHVKALDERLTFGKQSRIKLLTLWSDIATRGRKPLYAELFLKRGVLQSAPVFDDPLGNYLTAPGIKLKPYALALQGALGLTADEIARVLDDSGSSIEAADLTLPTVSLLYRFGLLAKALRLTVRELIVLKQLSGLDPFKPLHADPLTTIQQDYPFSQTLEFVTVAEQVKTTGLTIDDLDYLLRHRFDETGRYRPNRDRTVSIMRSLAEGVNAIRAEHAIPTLPSALTDEILTQKLGLVFPADVAATFVAMMSGTAQFTATRAVATADRLDITSFASETVISSLTYNITRQEQTITFRGVLFDPQKAELKTRLNPRLAAGQQAALASLLDAVQANAQKQADAFFVKELKQQPLNPSITTGFLEPADYELLFAPTSPALTAAQQQARDRQRRTRLAQTFLPFLQKRLIRQFVVQTITAQTDADPILVDSLLLDDRMLSLPGRLLDALTSTAERALTASFWPTPDAQGASSAKVVLVDGDIGALDASGNPLKPGGTNSALLEGYLEVPSTGAYRFNIELDQQNAEAELRFPHLPTPIVVKGTAAVANDTLGDQPNEFLQLTARVPYRFSLSLNRLNGGNARLVVQGETLPRGSLSQLTLYPAAAVEASDLAILLLDKALQLVTSLGLSEREMRYIVTHPADFGGVALSELPTHRVGDTPADRTATEQRFGRFRRLAAYTRLKRDLAGGTDDLIGIFEANGTALADRLVKEVYPRIAKLTRRDEATVKETAEALVTAPAVPAFASEEPLLRLWDGLQVVERFGVRPASLFQWTRIVNTATTPAARVEIARDIKEAVKARFEPETWQRVAQPIFDKLRQRQRDALVSHVMHQHGFDRMEQLYEYFLIDPGMEPVVQTSRIRLAIGSLQLFIQRCLLNLERKVHPSTINAGQWEWMKRYRVWEANRKIFLFPENWLEPEFRDDKTHLFVELEGALLQGDVSGDLVEDAFLSYLKKLDELARLDIAAMHIEDNDDPSQRVLHVFGRTYGQPHKYFYRRYARQMWTPWEPVTAEVSGDHLAPIVWRDRLYLFWVTFAEKPLPPAAGSVDPTKTIPIPAVSLELEAQLHWSEYLNGEWSTRESGAFDPPEAQVLKAIAVRPKRIFVHVSKKYESGEERGVHVHLSWPFNQTFYLAGRNSSPEKAEAGTPNALPGHPYTPSYGTQNADATRYLGSGPFKVSFASRVTTTIGGWAPGAVETPSILAQGRAFNLLPCNNDLTNLGISKEAYKKAANPTAVKAALERGIRDIAALIKPVFYQDNQHTLFVEPEVSETTVEQWEEWVTRTPTTSEPEWRDPKWWQEIEVIPKYPRKPPIPTPGDPLEIRINPGSLVYPARQQDWLTNPAVAVKYDDVVVGPSGQPGLEILTDAAPSIGHELVNVNPGSHVAGQPAAVVRDQGAFERSGLATNGVSLTIVGGAGYNSAMEKHFQGLEQMNIGREVARGLGARQGQM